MSPSADLARQLGPEIIRLRRDFHAHPELSFHESRTSDAVAAYLAELGLEVVRPDGMTGLWADLRVEGAARTLLFRADMDALAMQEGPGPNKASFLSTRDGAAHCCGHDAHMAMLLAAARALALGEAESKANLRFLFQHAEERPPGGAIQLIEAGCLDGVDECYGLHVIPPIPSGLFDVMPGPFMAAADNFTVEVVGQGGHAAMPHLVRDPIAASAQVLSALQQLVSRDASPFEALVLTVSSIRGGSDTHNVVADRCTLKGTARTLDRERARELPGLVEGRLRAAAESAGCELELDWERGYPVLINTPAETAKARAAVVAAFGDDALLPQPVPLMGGEDFARYLEQRPGCYVFLGVGAPDKGIRSPNHARDFDVDEGVLYRGTAWFLELARQG